MKSLSLYTKDDEDLHLQSAVKRFSDDIGINIALDKYAKVTFTKSSLVKFNNITLGINIQNHRESHKTYEYFGNNEVNAINYTHTKKR